MRKYLRIVDDSRATKLIRLANYIIDYLVVYFIFFMLGIIGSLLTYVDIYFIYNWLADESSGSKIMDSLISMIVYFLYIFTIEVITKGRSLGKYITGTKVVMTDAKVPTVKDFLIRNLSRLIPFDVLSFLGNNGWHDTLSNTRVVNIKAFENAKISAQETILS